MEQDKSVIHCKVEHSLLIVKKQIGYVKVVYKDLRKTWAIQYFCLPMLT